MSAPREITDNIYWFKERHCWRFPYRDPWSGARKFLFCTPDKFEKAGIDLPFPDVVRKDTATAQGLCKRLQTVFLRSLAGIEPEPPAVASAPAAKLEPPRIVPADSPPILSAAIEEYFTLYEKTPSYERGLRSIFQEFLVVTGDRPIDAVRDLDLKTYERHIANRVRRTTVRSYMRQLAMLFHFAVRKGWVRQDPRLTYRLPKEELPDPNPFSDEEVKAFFEFVRRPARFRPEGWAAMEWTATGFLVLGLRPIVLQHVRWEHVNFDNRFVFVSVSHGAKVKQARQWQPIPLAAWPLFLKRRKASGFVWKGHFRGPLTDDSLGRMRRTIQSEFPDFTWKRFRKTYATIIGSAGNDISVVSRLLRHSAGGRNMSVAERHYMGRSDGLLRDIVDEAFDPLREVIAPGRKEALVVPASSVAAASA